MDKRGGVSRFSVEKFLSHYTKMFHWRTLWCFRKILHRKFPCIGEGITVLSKIFASQYRNETLCKGTLLFSRKFRVSKNFMPKRGISRFSIENLVSHSTNKLRRETLLCFTKLLVSKNLWIRGGEGVSRFSFKKFLSHSAEKFRKRTIYCSTNFGYRKNLCLRGLCHDLLSNFFCLAVPKNFVGEPFCAVFQKISGTEKVYG